MEQGEPIKRKALLCIKATLVSARQPATAAKHAEERGGHFLRNHFKRPPLLPGSLSASLSTLTGTNEEVRAGPALETRASSCSIHNMFQVGFQTAQTQI